MFVYCRVTFACAHTKAFALSTKRYNFCGARSRNHHSRFRPVYVWLLLIIVVSRLAVQRDITAAMAAIPEIGSIVMAWQVKAGRKTLRTVIILRVKLCWR